MSGVLDEEDESNIKLYDILNVSKDATEEQIKASYRRLCQTYHPDKHTDPVKKDVATKNFTRVKEAYEVLSDPLKRRVYDEYGVEGIRTVAAEGLELSVWEDIQSRFQREAPNGTSNQKTNEKDSLLTVHNQVKVSTDGTGLVSFLEDVDAGLEGNPFIITQMTLSSNLTAYVTNRDILAASYNITTRGVSRSPASSFSITGRRTFDADTFAEVSYIYGVSRKRSSSTLTAKLWRKLTATTSSMLEATYDSNQDLLNLVLSMVRQLSDRWMSQLAWVTGAQHGVMWTIRHSPAHEGGGLVDGGFDEKEERRISLRERLVMFFSTMIFNTTCRLGSFDTSLSVSIQKGLGSSWQDGGISGGFAKLRAKVGIGTWDLELSGGRNIIDWNSGLGAGVSLSVEGVTLRLKISRGGHKISIPVLLSSETRPGLATVALSLLVGIAAFVQYQIVNPIQKAQLLEAKEEARRTRKVAMERSQSDAEASLELMTVAIERSREQEEEAMGLVITRALFGSAAAVKQATVEMESVKGREIELELVECADALQYLVQDSKVLLYTSSKSSIQGVWDPTALEDDERALAVWYNFRGIPHYCIMDSYEPLEIPLRSHRLQIAETASGSK
ncbi:hypothetical protein NDN08_000917 [Rhodosorus marinus]|uniref:J domain-containing protein n=1 Tax=Rhodosorus marinus TaxID=101924 RepID=A0AAV8UPH1_9RHOD|nr:hypothetical protein NDN08_000917 [Rhodosorus marinus]